MREWNLTYSSIIKMAKSILNLTKTDIEILKILIPIKSGLLISDIINIIERSERNIRKRIAFLSKIGILKRKIEVLENKRLAYRYFIEKENIIIEKITNDLHWKILTLNKLNIEKINEYRLNKIE